MSRDTGPFFSIITPVYNGAAYLGDLIASVQAQTWRDYEHIIIDDGSDDDGATVSIIAQAAAHDPRIRWWSRPNKGQYATQNEALDAAAGQVVMVIAADDVLHESHVLAYVAQRARQTPQPDLIYGISANMAADGTPTPRLSVTWRPSRWLMRHLVYAQHCAVYLRRDLIATHNLHFDETLHYTGDWDWLVRVWEAAERIAYLKRPLATIRTHPGQTSRTAGAGAIAAEHRLVCQRYGASYRLHHLLTWLNNYRAMLRLAWHTLRTQGMGAFLRRVVDWLRRRFSPRSR